MRYGSVAIASAGRHIPPSVDQPAMLRTAGAAALLRASVRATRTFAADASDADALSRLAEGVAVIYSCAGPAYPRWVTDWRNALRRSPRE